MRIFKLIYFTITYISLIIMLKIGYKMVIKFIAGIGNIGSKYENTRHNFGHQYIQLLSYKYSVFLKRNNILRGYISELKIKNFITYLFIPNSYVNNSGLSISKCINFYRLSLSEVLIVHDELDLLPGSIRITLGTQVKASHRGIKDIIDKLDNNFNFYRLRIGIGRPHNNNEIVNFVLNQPSDYEKNKIDFIINKTIFYTEDIISGNFIKVMNKLHIY